MPSRKISRCPQDFIDLLYKIADLSNMQLTKYVVELGSEDIDNSYFSGIYKVQIIGIKDGQKIRKKILIKWHSESRMRACYRESYRREFIFYRHIIPKLLDVQKDLKDIEGLKMKFPNCIFACDEYDQEALAVEGLFTKEFRLSDRLLKVKLDYVSLVMKNLAKLHALSFVLKKTHPKDFEEITRLCRDDVQYYKPGPVPKSMKSYYEASVNVVLDTAARDKLYQLTPDILTVLYKCTQPDPNSTICHGDCWNNNILYKHRGSKPVDVVFVDYQMTRFASPVTDISYFLYMSADGDFLKKHYDQVLDIYYGTLSAVLRYSNMEVENVYPRNIFQKHLKEYSVFGLIEALVSMMIITAPYEDAIKLTEMKYEHCDEEVPEDEYRDHSIFVERVNGIVNDFFDRKYSLNAILRK